MNNTGSTEEYTAEIWEDLRIVDIKAGARWYWRGPGWYECEGGHNHGDGMLDVEYHRLGGYTELGDALEVDELYQRIIDRPYCNAAWYDMTPDGI